MASVKVKMNSAGARELLNSAEVQADLLKRAGGIKASAQAFGGTYEADVQPGRNRAHAMVKTKPGDFRTMYKQAKHNALLNSMGAGR